MGKIIFYIDSMQMGGAQRVMNNLLDYFVSLEYEVYLINDNTPDMNLPEYEVNIRVKRLYLECEENNRLLKNIARIKKLRKIIKQINPIFILSFLGPPNIRMLLATIGLRCRKIVSVRNDPYKEYGSGLAKKVTNLIFKLADGCVFQTEEAAKYFPVSFRKKSRIIFNPVGERFYRVKRTDNPHDIVTVGRLYPQKNHELLIKAFSKISYEFPNENLIIYGEGELRTELENLVGNLCLKNRVLFPGNISNIPEKLAEAKIFVLSSDYEGMPNALMEAMAVGVPVISTDCPCGGPSTLIQNNVNGILIACNNVNALSASLRTFLSSEDREYIGMKGQQSAKTFKEDKIYKQWENYLRGCYLSDT